MNIALKTAQISLTPIPTIPRIGTVSTTYVKDDTAKDSPNSCLPDIYGEHKRQFSAEMFLMWTPNAEATCGAGAVCAIPVPLGSITWGYTGDAINTRGPQTNQGASYLLWVKHCGDPWKNGFQAGTTFPEWVGPAH